MPLQLLIRAIVSVVPQSQLRKLCEPTSLAALCRQRHRERTRLVNQPRPAAAATAAAVTRTASNAHRTNPDAQHTSSSTRPWEDAAAAAAACTRQAPAAAAARYRGVSAAAAARYRAAARAARGHRDPDGGLQDGHRADRRPTCGSHFSAGGGRYADAEELSSSSPAANNVLMFSKMQEGANLKVAVPCAADRALVFSQAPASFWGCCICCLSNPKAIARNVSFFEFTHAQGLAGNRPGPPAVRRRLLEAGDSPGAESEGPGSPLATGDIGFAVYLF